jgi:cytochrome c2
MHHLRPSTLLLLATAALTLAGCAAKERGLTMAGGEEGRGKALIERYGCIACHAIPGIAGPHGNVGPPLMHIGRRAYLAGILPHTPDAMLAWLRDPPAVDPATAMPRLGLSEQEARDIAAFLYAQD